MKAFNLSDIDLTKYCTSYGKYDAVITVQNSKLAAGKEEIAKTQFDVVEKADEVIVGGG